MHPLSCLRNAVVIGHQRDGCPTEDVDEIASLRLALDKQYLGLIKTCLQSDRADQALDVAKCLTHPQTLAAAIKLAEFFHAAGLVERLRRLEPAVDEDGRRESKWSHLADDRLVVGQHGGRMDNRSGDALARDFNETRPLWPRKSMPAAAPMATTMSRGEDSGVGSSDVPMEDEDDEEESAPAPVRLTVNPFKKVPGDAPRLAAVASDLPAQPALKKSRSFFDRVESTTAKGRFRFGHFSNGHSIAFQQPLEPMPALQLDNLPCSTLPLLRRLRPRSHRRTKSARAWWTMNRRRRLISNQCLPI